MTQPILPVMPCRQCGASGIPRLAPGPSWYTLSAICQSCGAIIKQVPRLAEQRKEPL